MDIKKIKLSPEEKKRLKELVAEEEQKLDEQELDDEKLLEEEGKLQEQWDTLLASKNKVQPKDGEENTKVVSSNDRQDHLWQKLKSKIDAKQPESGEPLGGNSRLYSTFSKASSGASGKKKTTRNYQVGMILAAAGVLLTSYLVWPDFKRMQEWEEPNFTYKGTDQHSFQADLVCDYRVIWHPPGDGSDIQSASLSDDRRSYLIGAESPAQLAVKCLTAGVYGHGKLRVGDSSVAEFRNLHVSANQWNLLPSSVSEAWALEAGQDAQFIVLMTSEPLDENVLLPVMRESTLGGHSVLEYHQITVRAESK